MFSLFDSSLHFPLLFSYYCFIKRNKQNNRKSPNEKTNKKTNKKSKIETIFEFGESVFRTSKFTNTFFHHNLTGPWCRPFAGQSENEKHSRWCGMDLGQKQVRQQNVPNERNVPELLRWRRRLGFAGGLCVFNCFFSSTRELKESLLSDYNNKNIFFIIQMNLWNEWNTNKI